MYSGKNVEELIAVADHDPKAMCQIGIHYADGTGGVEKDWNKAAEYFRKAAERGHADAQFCLSVCYGLGLGVSTDAIESASWCFRAAARGSEGAKKILYETDPSLLASVTRGEDGLRENLRDLKLLKKLATLDRLGTLEKLRTLIKADNLENPEEKNG